MLLARVRRTVRERRLLAHGERVVAAVSGGADSMAMLDVLARLRHELGVELEVASVDHGLRPEAAGEVDLVRARSADLQLPFHALVVSVPNHGSIQSEARRARYQALRLLASERGATAIATGHTRDDQAETVLARVLRGAGPPGIAGIEPRREDGVMRPLLDATRHETRTWCIEHGIGFVDDPSNVDSAFQRVRIRQDILPRLRREDPQLDLHLVQLADDLRALSEMVTELATKVLLDARTDEPSTLGVAPLLAAPRTVRIETLRIWAEQLTAKATRRAHLDALHDALFSKGEALLGDLWRVRREGAFLRARRDPNHRLAHRRSEREEA